MPRLSAGTGARRCLSVASQSSLLLPACLVPQATSRSTRKPSRPVKTARPTSKKPIPWNTRAAGGRGQGGGRGGGAPGRQSGFVVKGTAIAGPPPHTSHALTHMMS